MIVSKWAEEFDAFGPRLLFLQMDLLGFLPNIHFLCHIDDLNDMQTHLSCQVQADEWPLSPSSANVSIAKIMKD